MAMVPNPAYSLHESGREDPTHQNGGNGHRHRPRRQVQHGHRRAALKADTAVLLILVTGMAVTEAIERCATDARYFYAMKALRESGNTALHNAVLQGDAPMSESAKHVKNAAAAITALKKCSTSERQLVRLATGFTDNVVTALLNISPDQRVAASQALGDNWIWDNMVLAAMPASKAPSKAPSESTMSVVA